MNDRPTGVILAGGASTRMGRDKAFVEIAGRPMILRVADALSAAGCDPVFCQGGDAARLDLIGLVARPDPEPAAGPLVAISSALGAAATSILVAACDLADLDPAAVRAVIDGAADQPVPKVAVAVADGRSHLVSLWPFDALQPLIDVIADGVTSYRVALDRLGAVAVPVESSAVRNVNRPEDVGGDR